MRENKIIISYTQTIDRFTHSIVNSCSSSEMSDKLSDVQMRKDTGECDI